MRRLTYILILSLLPLGLSAQAEMSTEEAIAHARAYQGSEELLDSVRTLIFRGTITRTASAEGEEVSNLEIYLKKPDKQRFVIRVENITDVRMVDGSIGYRLTTLEEEGQPPRSRDVALTPQEIFAIQATTWQNLFFYKGIEKELGRVRSLGMKEFQGEDAYALRFEHTGNVFFEHHFHAETGRLMGTTTGSQIFINEGEQIVAGVKFPERVRTTDQEGNEINFIDFHTIEVNAVLADTLFTLDY